MTGVCVGLVGDEIADASFFLAHPLSATDQAECMRILREEFAAAPDVEIQDQRATLAPAEATLAWTADRLTVRYGPLHSTRPPKLKITFENEAGAALETTTALAVRIDGDFAVYELWLLGRRQSYRRATVAREG